MWLPAGQPVTINFMKGCNTMKILSVNDAAFGKYGKVVTNVDFTELVEALKKTEIYRSIEKDIEINDFKTQDIDSINQYLEKVRSSGLDGDDICKLQVKVLQSAGFDRFDKNGSLADIKAFKTLKVEELDGKWTLYRRGYPTEGTGGYGYGQWWSDEKMTIEEARDKLAILENWGNPLTGAFESTPTKGTRCITGIAEEQSFYDDITGMVIEYRAGGAKQYWFNEVDIDWVR